MKQSINQSINHEPEARATSNETASTFFTQVNPTLDESASQMKRTTGNLEAHKR